MALNPNIPLQTQGIDTATPLRQLGHDMQRNKMMQMQQAEQAQMQELRDLQIIGQRYQNLDNREKSRINSVTMMAAELSPLLEGGDVDGALNKLKARRKNLGQQIAEGLPVDTNETDRLIQMLESGDVETAQANLKSQVQLGKMLGVLESPEGSPTANIRDFMFAKENPEFSNFLKRQGARQLSGTEAIVQQLIKEGSAANVGEALQILKGGAGATGRLGAEIEMGRQAEFEKQSGQNQSDLEYAPQIKAAETRGVKEEERLADLKVKMPKAKSTLISIKDKTAKVTGDIDEVINDLQSMTVPQGRVIAQHIPLTKSNAINKKLESIKANFFIDELTEMRANSPTGGAVGNASDAEGNRLANARAALDLNIQLPDLIENLKQAKQATLGAAGRMENAFNRDFQDINENAENMGNSSRLRYNPKTGDFE